MKNRIITISREFGSGGRTIGKMAAESLNIPCYDSQLIEKIAAESGCRTEARFSAGYPPVCNDPALVAAATGRLGALAPSLLPEPALTAEDFSFYQQRVPGVFFFLGAGDVPPLHAADFRFDDAILERGAALFRALLDLL